MAASSDPDVTGQVSDFYRGLPEKEADAFDAAVEKLIEQGPALGRPVVGAIVSGRIPHLKELRPLGTSIRVLFTFGPSRTPVLLYAGDKAGDWNRWYKKAIIAAEALYEAYLRHTGNGVTG